ncbi:MAG: guanylate kinase [Holosporaceae bacterium]|jgi:guanylate kinase|nr:guanylate kinase [Holosporaceae bacterium]
MAKRRYLFVVSGPSAVGKSSVVEEIFKRDASLKRIVTCTTRSPRGAEQHGVHYFFMDREEFAIHRENGDFIEFSEVYGNSYGVLFSSVSEGINDGETALFSINWEGFLKIKRAVGDCVYGFFLLPPSMEELKLRMKKRNTDSPEIMAHRLEVARNDLDHSGEFDFCLMNKSIEETAENILKQMNAIRQNV